MCVVSFLSFLFSYCFIQTKSCEQNAVVTYSVSITAKLTGICLVWGICFRGGRVGQKERGICVLSGCMIENREGSITQALLLVTPIVCTGLHVWGDIICLVLFHCCMGGDSLPLSPLTGFIWLA